MQPNANESQRLGTTGPVLVQTPTQINPQNPADGQHVVIQNGQRVTGSLSAQEAQTEAAKRNQVLESSGQPVQDSQRAQVRQNLFG